MLRNPVLSFLVLVSLTGPSIAISQQNEVSQAVQTTPITKVLAIGHLVSPPSGESFSSTMQSEVRDTVRLYLAGKIDQWYVRKDQNGVVFILNTPSVEDARVLLDSLPWQSQNDAVRSYPAWTAISTRAATERFTLVCGSEVDSRCTPL